MMIDVIAKPSGSRCNLDCDYCYYLGKSALYDKSESTMSESMLDLFIQRSIETQGSNATYYSFTWHGGEATLLGVEFYRTAVRLQKQYAKGKPCINHFQTNGILLNDEWCQFFAQEGFLVGISIDGTEQQHNKFRKNRAKRGTHKQVTTAIKLLQKHDVEFNALIVISQANVTQPLALYHHLKQLGISYFQFIPLVEETDQFYNQSEMIISPSSAPELMAWSLKPGQYASFLNAIFDEWFRDDIGHVFINIFETTLGILVDGQSNTCVFSKTCGQNLALEHNGDVYSCDHFVYKETKLGNIEHQSFASMLLSEKQKQFGSNKYTSLAKECTSCSYLHLCYGGCPKDRIATTANGNANLNYFCQDYQAYYRHVLPSFAFLTQCLEQDMTLQEVKNAIHKQQYKQH
ncbi:anaerobic sulfatase maturase [Vibrio sp. RE88]|uniref:anaerobic sulfatase maturase n=1 Tax=Vibrio sp. RE88 TaxID=2607610 RepID=UPI001493D69A|nr:anaerobic sulfatase maturase [Vibrio sp. RE88]NOH62333.1 anaerobic sulfatase maturase [Vibrio sp. RE88]